MFAAAEVQRQAVAEYQSAIEPDDVELQVRTTIVDEPLIPNPPAIKLPKKEVKEPPPPAIVDKVLVPAKSEIEKVIVEVPAPTASEDIPVPPVAEEAEEDAITAEVTESAEPIAPVLDFTVDQLRIDELDESEEEASLVDLTEASKVPNKDSEDYLGDTVIVPIELTEQVSDQTLEFELQQDPQTEVLEVFTTEEDESISADTTDETDILKASIDQEVLLDPADINPADQPIKTTSEQLAEQVVLIEPDRIEETLSIVDAIEEVMLEIHNTDKNDETEVLEPVEKKLEGLVFNLLTVLKLDASEESIKAALKEITEEKKIIDTKELQASETQEEGTHEHKLRAFISNLTQSIKQRLDAHISLGNFAIGRINPQMTLT